MDEDRRRWLERLAEAAARAAEDLRAHEGPAHRDLLEDLERLQEAVVAELRAAGL
jgi:hypothetical protein